MPEYLRAFVVIMFLAVVVFTFSRGPASGMIEDGDFRRRRNLWLAMTSIAFLSGNFWIYVAAAGLLVYVISRRENNVVALFFVLLFVAPEAHFDVSGLGIINRLFTMTPHRMLSLVLLLPAFFRMVNSRKGLRFGKVSVDYIVLIYTILVVLLNFRATTLTDGLRFGFDQFLDVLLPYFVISRVLAENQKWKDALMCFVLAVLVMAPVAVFEMVRGWLLYESLVVNAWGMPRQLSPFLARAGFLRATAAPGNPIALGYIMAIAIGLCLYLQRYLVSGFFRRLGFAVLTAGLLAALSRGPWVGAVVILFVWIVTGRHAATRLVKVAMLVLPLFLVLPLVPGGQTVINLIPFIGETERENIDYRGSLFDNSLPVIMRNPLFGSPDYINSPEMEAMRQGQGIIDVVNTYLQIALAYGLVTLFFFVAIFLSIGLKLLSFIRRSPDTSAEPVELCRSILAIICGIMVTIATVSSVSFVPIVYWCFAGVGAACMLKMPDWRHQMLDPKHKRAV